MIVKAVRHGSPRRPGGDDETRNSKSALTNAARLPIGLRHAVGDKWRRNMVKKSAPLVKVDDQDRVRPLRAGDNRVVDFREKRLPVANVGEGVGSMNS